MESQSSAFICKVSIPQQSKPEIYGLVHA